ncbi:ABC transporter permease [Garciella nitratireducens]|uniref:ABC transporter permease n=1 Tax=Garciella nitratireducens TaxID=218205 RepID=UPI0024B51BBF|nr:ABC transporter permease [Garciella nitratireducens]
MSISQFFDLYGNMMLKAIITHLAYVSISVGLGFIIALILGILLSRLPKVSKIVLPVISIFQTIPGLVFIGVLFIYLGMVPITVIFALTIYSIFPILKNTYTGILNVDQSIKEAAKGCGMTNVQILFKIELPLASSAIFSGLRMSTIYTVSWAVLAAMIGLGGLGEFIYRGISTNNNTLIIGGAIPAAILAIFLGIIIDKIQKRITPRGLQRRD